MSPDVFVTYLPSRSRNTKKYWTLYTRTGERAFFGCFGFFGSLRCLSRLPIGVSFHVVKSFGALGTRHSSDRYLVPRISRVWPDMLMPNDLGNRRPAGRAKPRRWDVRVDRRVRRRGSVREFTVQIALHPLIPPTKAKEHE